jgi:hypothetical protein
MTKAARIDRTYRVAEAHNQMTRENRRGQALWEQAADPWEALATYCSAEQRAIRLPIIAELKAAKL